MPTRTVGVEEELLLVAAEHGRPFPRGADVVAAATDRTPAVVACLGERVSVENEFKREQAEISTPPCSSLDDLAQHLCGRE